MFLAKLNREREGYSFTPEASIRIKSIPSMFRSAAMTATFAAAEKEGVSVIDEAILDIVQSNR